ncbi:MAG: type II toxin-antitoxin system RelE/ParE family toxin [Acetobacterium sp.]|nr:type II toxin-antitoxin system RelE/ParE family toxin [Bacillota bacterium]MCG2728878.1 type II toxin-antitoxin system RelE/ParE family toxin [Acetobacterium sp.]
MTRLQISPEARDDVLLIKEYIAEELGNPQASIELMRKITAKMRNLIDQLQLVPSLTSRIAMQTNYHYLSCQNYMIFYWCEDDLVFVSRVLYGRRDYLRILFKDLLEE